MFNYNPAPNNVGALLQSSGAAAADTNLKGSELLASGITQGAQGISGAIDQMAKYNQLHQQAMGTAGAAHSLKLIDADQLAQFNQMAPAAQIGFAQNIAPLIQAKGMAAYHSGLLDMKQQALDAKGVGSGTLTNLY